MQNQKSTLDEQNSREMISQPDTGDIENESVRTDSGGVAVENTLSRRKKQTIENIITEINENNSNEIMDSCSESQICETSTIKVADTPPMRTPICHSISQVYI